jgi:transposase InsO family protein
MVVSDIDQLWVADITYIRLQSEFVYLGAVIDAYSRRVIGWALDRTVEDDLPLAALRSALELRRPSTWVGASLRSRQPVCLRRLHGAAEGPRLPNQYESQGESLGKWRL